MKLLNTAPPDAVTELLSALTVQSSVYCLSELTAPWGFRADDANVAKFHLVLEGRCWLQADGNGPMRLATGDLVILPRGEAHVVSDEQGSPAPGLEELIAGHPLDGQARLRYGGSGSATRLLCGAFTLGGPVRAPLLSMLPPVLHLDAVATGVTAWLEPVFALVAHEADHAAPGAQAIFTKLADVFLAQALRAYLTGAEQAGLLRMEPLADPPVRATLALIRDQPGRPWTLAALAREAGMSRTLFATRFRAAVGESPMRHLAKVRLGQAAGYLTTTNLSIEAIARHTGYGTSAALSKAFRREFGTPPGKYRAHRGMTETLQAR
ncbi:MAG TPA: AraC family transcriptional regulator [Streptosporangiaceae bacterium]